MSFCCTYLDNVQFYTGCVPFKFSLHAMQLAFSCLCVMLFLVFFFAFALLSIKIMHDVEGASSQVPSRTVKLPRARQGALCACW